jgi:hypothetical protein
VTVDCPEPRAKIVPAKLRIEGNQPGSFGVGFGFSASFDSRRQRKTLSIGCAGAISTLEHAVFVDFEVVLVA